MKDDSIINLQSYQHLGIVTSQISICIHVHFLKYNILLIYPSKFLIPQNYLLGEKYSAILVSKKKNIFVQKERIEGNLKYFILLMPR